MRITPERTNIQHLDAQIKIVERMLAEAFHPACKSYLAGFLVALERDRKEAEALPSGVEGCNCGH